MTAELRTFISISGTRLGGGHGKQPLGAREWEEIAPCSGSDPEAWFQHGHAPDQVLAICASCPINTKTACLQMALDNDERSGIWGGLTASERRKIKRQPDAGERPARILPDLRMTCHQCGGEYVSKSPLSKYCTRGCNNDAVRDQRQQKRAEQEGTAA